MTASHARASAPSPLLGLVCLAVVHRLRPAWVTLPLHEAAAQEGVSTERLSRLCSRAIEPFTGALDLLTRRGRPPRDRAESVLAGEVAILRALLDVARELLAFLPRRRRKVRALLVGAWLRLREAHPSLRQRRFCEAMALSTRTLRHWLREPARSAPRPSKPPQGEPPQGEPRPRGPRRPRFTFDVVLPGTQYAADTTDLCAFGVPLKLLAVQDVGGRDQDLFDAVIVQPRESAELVAQLFDEACAEHPGAQMLTDQGTPYMAQRTLEQLEKLELEHAPNVEGDPRGKATIERAFETAKAIARPLLAITDELAVRMPALANLDLARATARVLLAAVLRAYQAGARAAQRAVEARGAIDADTLARAAHQQREHARSDQRSARLILARIHDAYGLPGAAKPFVDSFRRYSPAVLLDAEKRFASQVHRDNIRNRRSYFAAILRRVSEEHRRERERERRQHADDERIALRHREHQEQRAHHLAHPLEWLRDALDLLAAHWLPNTRSLLFDGKGLGQAWAKMAVAQLVDLHGPLAARDLAASCFRDWSRLHLERLGDDGVRAVLAAAQPFVNAIPKPDHQLGCCAGLVSAMLRSTGPPARPAPQEPLRN